jgi:hypothetical protein
MGKDAFLLWWNKRNTGTDHTDSGDEQLARRAYSEGFKTGSFAAAEIKDEELTALRAALEEEKGVGRTANEELQRVLGELDAEREAIRSNKQRPGHREVAGPSEEPDHDR